MDGWQLVCLPFLHFTVGLAAVVDKSSDVTHAVSVDDKLTVQRETIVVVVSSVLHRHTLSELVYSHHFTCVLQDKLTCKYKTDLLL